MNGASDLKEMVLQCKLDSQRWFPETYNGDATATLAFQALALGGEAGEFQNIVKKIVRGTMTLEEARSALAEEAVDVLIYLCNIFAALEVDPVKIYAIKRRRNEQRFGNGHRVGDSATAV